MPEPKDAMREERELAWIGDAALSLVAREYILSKTGNMDAQLFASLTSNQFLSSFGVPTKIEAELGVIYQTKGLEAVRETIHERFIPVFESQQRKKARGK